MDSCNIIIKNSITTLGVEVAYNILEVGHVAEVADMIVVESESCEAGRNEFFATSEAANLIFVQE